MRKTPSNIGLDLREFERGALASPTLFRTAQEEAGLKRRATSPGVALRAACIAAAIAVGLPFASAAEQSALQRWLAGEVGLAAGFDYSEGDYGKGGGTKTKMLFLPFTLTYLFDDFALTPTPRDQVELRVIVPFISVDGGIAAIDSGEQDKSDVIVAASYLYHP